ncbi:MAG: hypothetical protein ACI8Y4_003931 [Candidatus Poriferisodalaceae bacterium]|jgi:hypothetical protein
MLPFRKLVDLDDVAARQGRHAHRGPVQTGCSIDRLTCIDVVFEAAGRTRSDLAKSGSMPMAFIPAPTTARQTVESIRTRTLWVPETRSWLVRQRFCIR